MIFSRLDRPDLFLEKWGDLSLNFEIFYLFIMRYIRKDDFLQQGSYKITVTGNLGKSPVLIGRL
jgi:hypothetical protein